MEASQEACNSGDISLAELMEELIKKELKK